MLMAQTYVRCFAGDKYSPNIPSLQPSDFFSHEWTAELYLGLIWMTLLMKGI